MGGWTASQPALESGFDFGVAQGCPVPSFRVLRPRRSFGARPWVFQRAGVKAGRLGAEERSRREGTSFNRDAVDL